jgi:hypothetical protein
VALYIGNVPVGVWCVCVWCVVCGVWVCVCVVCVCVWCVCVCGLSQCFSTFVRPRPSKFFSSQDEGPVPTDLLVSNFPIFF